MLLASRTFQIADSIVPQSFTEPTSNGPRSLGNPTPTTTDTEPPQRDLSTPISNDTSENYKTLIKGAKFDLIEDDNILSNFDLSIGKDFKLSSGNVLRNIPKGTKGVNMVNGKQLNTGVDLAAPIGTPVSSVGDGEVVKVGKGYNGGYGNFVLVKHLEGDREVFSRYSHMGEDISLKAGQQIKKGDIVGKVSVSGNSSGPHSDRELFFKGEDGKTKFIFQDRKL